MVEIVAVMPAMIHYFFCQIGGYSGGSKRHYLKNKNRHFKLGI
jgi:hypothetical protein